MTLYAVKALGGGKIEAYAVRWGSPQEPDRSEMKDFFTPQTDLMLDAWGWPRPVLHEHQPVQVGQWHRATKDSVGVKLSGQLDTAHSMYPQLDQDIRAGRYFLSSDSAGHLVKRRRHANGTHELERWALLTASLTKSPAEHRLLPVAAVKALALKQGARHSASDRTDMQTLHDIAVRQGATCAPAKSRDLDLIGELTKTFGGDRRAARTWLLLDDLEDLERAARLRETPEEQKARLLAQLDKLREDTVFDRLQQPNAPRVRPPEGWETR